MGFTVLGVLMWELATHPSQIPCFLLNGIRTECIRTTVLTSLTYVLQLFSSPSLCPTNHQQLLTYTELTELTQSCVGFTAFGRTLAIRPRGRLRLESAGFWGWGDRD